MRLSAPRLAISAVAIGAVAATTGLALSATGPTNPTSVVNRGASAQAPAPASVHTRVTQSEAQVRAFWTAANLKAAKPLGKQLTPAQVKAAVTADVASGPEVSADGTLPEGSANAAGGVSAAGARAAIVRKHGKAPAITTGKIFFTRYGKKYVCSGSVVTAANRSTVWTAGHCLHEGNNSSGGWNSYTAFRPDYVQGRSRGTWVARELWTTPQWYRSTNPSYDVAALIVYRASNGRRLNYYTGAQGLIFNARGLKHFVRSFGYPEVDHWGRVMRPQGNLWTCSGNTWGLKWRSNGKADRLMHCSMGGGSSGGPWLYGMKKNGLGRVIGNVSHGLSRSGHRDDWTTSPYYGAQALRLWNDVKRRFA